MVQELMAHNIPSTLTVNNYFGVLQALSLSFEQLWLANQLAFFMVCVNLSFFNQVIPGQHHHKQNV